MTSKLLNPTAQYIIIAKLNHCFDRNHLSMQELATLLGVERITIRRSAQELERLGLAHRVRGRGVKSNNVYLVWDKEKLDLWIAAFRYMRNPIVRHYHVTAPEDLSLFTPGGLHLLNRRFPSFAVPGKTHLVHKGASQARNKNESLIQRGRPSEADYVGEFWSYPPILPGHTEIDNLSLFLSTNPGVYENADSAHCKLISTFDWDGNENNNY